MCINNPMGGLASPTEDAVEVILMKKIFLSVVIILMTPLTLWCAGLLWFSATAITTEQKTTSIPKTDAIIVLTGDKGRIDEGFYLFATNRAPRLFISGVNRDVTEDMLKQQWNGAPLPDCCLDIGYTAVNTWGNALESVNWINKNKIKTVFLVTSDYHMPRARLEFSFVAPDVTIYPHPIHNESNDRPLYQYGKLMIGEYHKTILTYLRHLFNPKLL